MSKSLIQGDQPLENYPPTSFYNTLQTNRHNDIDSINIDKPMFTSFGQQCQYESNSTANLKTNITRNHRSSSLYSTQRPGHQSYKTASLRQPESMCRQMQMTEANTDPTLETQSENISSDEAAEDNLEMSEAKCSQKLATNLDNNKFKMIKDTQTHVSSETEYSQQLTQQQQLPMVHVDQDSIMKNLFYLNQPHKQFKYKNNVSTIKHKQMEYVCINQQNQNQRVVIDFIDISERANDDQRLLGNQQVYSSPRGSQKPVKSKSLIYISHLPINNDSQDSQQSAQGYTNDIRIVSEMQGYYSFDQMYNNLTEKLINKVIDNEFEQRAVQVMNKNMSTQKSGPFSYLLINDKDKFENKKEDKENNTPQQQNHKSKCEQLYKLGQAQRQKNERLRELNEQKIIKQENQECTFQPNMTSCSDSSKKQREIRSPDKFYEDMVKFQEQVEGKLMSLRIIEEQQQQSKKSLLSVSSRNEFFDRLFSENLKKPKDNSCGVTDSSFSPNQQAQKQPRSDLVQHLYSDHFIRDNKLKTLQYRCQLYEQQEHQNAIDLSRSNLVLARKIASSVQQAYLEMNLQSNDLLSFFNFVEIMTKLGYIKGLNDQEKALLNIAWTELIHDNSRSSPCDQGISQRNLTIFLLATENIFAKTMSSYPCQNKVDRKFGYFINNEFYIENEQDVKKIHLQFELFYTNRQERSTQVKKECRSPTQQAQEDLNRQSFRPTINTRSRMIASKSFNSLKRTLTQTNTNNQNQEQPHMEQMSQTNPLQGSRTNLALSDREKKEIEECTFSPKLNQTYNSNQSRNRRGQVFNKLYGQAKTYNKLANKTTEQVEFESNQTQCTFRPNLASTQKINQSIKQKTNQSPQIKIKIIHRPSFNQQLQQVDIQDTQYDKVNMTCQDSPDPIQRYLISESINLTEQKVQDKNYNQQDDIGQQLNSHNIQQTLNMTSQNSYSQKYLRKQLAKHRQ